MGQGRRRGKRLVGRREEADLVSPRVISGRSTGNAQAGAGMKPPPDALNIC